MASERKSLMISARVPIATMARVDFVVRNIDNDDITNRSVALVAALEAWLPAQERRLEDLGIIPKKAR